MPKQAGERKPRQRLTVRERLEALDESIARHEEAITRLRGRKFELAEAARQKAAALMADAGLVGE